MTTAATLERLAKSAVDESEGSGKPLSSVLVEVLQNKDLNSEQIRRVVEFANIEAFNRGFASTSGDYRMVDIPHGPADPAQVLQDLYAGREEAAMQDTSDYDYAPSSSNLGDDDATFEEDSQEIGSSGDLAPLASKVAAAAEQLYHSFESEKVKLSLALDELQGHVKRAMKQGASPSAIMSEWQAIDAEVAKVAAPLLAGLIETRGHIKESSKRINPAHPVCTVFAKVASHSRAADEFEAACYLAVGETEKIARQAAAVKAGEGAVSLAKSIGRGIRSLADTGASVGEGIARGAGVGDTPGKIQAARYLGGGVALTGTGLAGLSAVDHVGDKIRERNERRRQEKEFRRMQRMQMRGR